MIREVAEITVRSGDEDRFLAAAGEAVALFEAAEGCRSMHIERVVETPYLFRLIVEWQTLDDHVVTFRGSEGFQKWRALVGPYFDAPPRVDHTEVVLTGFRAG